MSMSPWMTVLWLVLAAGAAYMIFWRIRKDPQAFSKANLSKSLTTLGVLGLLLIAFIWLLLKFLQ